MSLSDDAVKDKHSTSYIDSSFCRSCSCDRQMLLHLCHSIIVSLLKADLAQSVLARSQDRCSMVSYYVFPSP